MKYLYVLLMAVSSTGYSYSGSQCSVDSDCEAGESCVRGSGYEVNGRCTVPSIIHAEKPKSCIYDTQCGSGMRCVKSQYSTYGRCSY